MRSRRRSSCRRPSRRDRRSGSPRPLRLRRGRNEAREGGCRRVHEQELREGEVDAVRQTGRAERERVETLGADAAAEELESLLAVAERPSRSPTARRGATGSNLARIAGTLRTTATMATRTRTTDVIRRPEGALNFRSPLSMARSTNGSVSRTSAISTIVSDRSSTAPPATASPVGVPIRCRKRMLIPIRPAELGTVRLMNLIADCEHDARQQRRAAWRPHRETRSRPRRT